MIQAESITDCQLTTDNDTATGTVSFTAKGLYSGRVEFIARRNDGTCQIEEFRLPGYGIKAARGTDGKWKRSDLQFKGQ